MEIKRKLWKKNESFKKITKNVIVAQAVLFWPASIIAGSPPVNDACGDAIEVVVPYGGSATIPGTTLDATVDAAPFCGTAVTSPGVWYKTTNDVGSLLASTCDQADYDTKISIYKDGCGTLTCVDGIDDTTGCANFTTELEVPTIGTEYLVLVHGFGGATGDFDLTLEHTPDGAYAEVGGKTVCTGGNESQGSGDGNGQFTPIDGCGGPAYWGTDTFVSGVIELPPGTGTGDPESFPYIGTPTPGSELVFKEKNPSVMRTCTYTPGPSSTVTIDEDKTVLSVGWLTNCWDADDVQDVTDSPSPYQWILTNGTGGKGRDKNRGNVCSDLNSSGACDDDESNGDYTLKRGMVTSGEY